MSRWPAYRGPLRYLKHIAPLIEVSHDMKKPFKIGRQALKVTKTIGALVVESSGETPQ